MDNINFYEVEMKNSKDKEDSYSMCIKGTRKPSITEAKEFLKNDLENLGYDVISDVLEISKEDAFNFFDMENEQNFPIFGLN